MINDTINSMGVDFTKDLHGHVRVETRDRWTGRVVDSQEKDNLVTNAAAKMLMTPLWFTATGNASNYAGGVLDRAWSPLYAKAFGTLLAFDSTLTESASNISFPSSAKLVAWAGQNANSSDAMRGSYNPSESVFTTNGFTTVWDFLTSQANGTIASLARTSSFFVENPVARQPSSYIPNIFSNTYYPTNYTLCAMGYDESNHYLYLYSIASTTIGSVTFNPSTIYRAKLDFGKIHLLNALPPADQIETVKTLTSSDGTSSAVQWRYDKYNNNFIYFSGTTIHIVAIDGTHTTKTATGTSGSSFVATENYYWRSTGSVVYRIQKNNTSNIQSFSISNSTHLAAAENDIVFSYTQPNPFCNLIYPDGTFVLINTDVNVTWAYDATPIGPFYAFQYSADMQGNTNYLGTIANLDNPVTKTSSQTMKITYTLTEA